MTYRAGTATLRSSGAPTGETTVTFSTPLANANYLVSYIFTSDVAWGQHIDVYLWVTNKTASGFTFVLNAADGAPVNAPSGTTLDWLALPAN
jgi:hypothetical protein